MSAPFSPWERNSTVDWAYAASAHPDDWSARAVRSIGADVLLRMHSRLWCAGGSDAAAWDAACLVMDLRMTLVSRKGRR